MNYYEKIYNNLKDGIISACDSNAFKPYNIPPELLFALCCNEAGKLIYEDKPVPERFEPHVNNALLLVKRGEKNNYKGITFDDLVEYSPDLVYKLSCSYGITQIMGWWTVKHISYSVSDLKAYPLQATLAILTLSQDKQPIGNEAPLEYIQKMDYESVFRIWNTGKHDGKTYHEDYVKNGFKAVIMWLKYNP